MRRIACWILGAAALCSALCAIYGVFSLLMVQQRLNAGATEVRVLLDGSGPANPPRAVEEPKAALDHEAEGLLCFERYEVAVYHGVTEEILAKGAGHIPASAELGVQGNSVLYGHRDSAFRFLAKLGEGDELSLRTRDGEKRYRVTSILIMEPDDPEIFTATTADTLSLVTCYPFTFVGPALQRCVVRAAVL